LHDSGRDGILSKYMGAQVSAQRRTRPPADSVREILDAVRHLVRELRLSHQEALRRVGLSAAQVFVLQSLEDGQPLSLGEVAKRTATDQSSVSVVVARLVKARLVNRRRSLRDGRRLELGLTPAGRALLRKAPPSLAQESLVQALEKLPSGERHSLARLLGRVVVAMGAGKRAPRMFFEPGDKDRRHGS
jgi:DNA-binding MarR family transcriptional regulator